MTDEIMNLRTLLEKSSDADRRRSLRTENTIATRSSSCATTRGGPSRSAARASGVAL